MQVSPAFAIFLTLVFGFALESFAIQQNELLLTNGSFAKWKSGKPVGWELGEGATTGNSNRRVKSIVKKGDGPSLQLQGKSQTNYWQFVSQNVNLKKNTAYVLSFEAAANGLKREQGQFDNSFVSVSAKDARNQDLQKHYLQVSNSKRRSYLLPFKTNQRTKSAQIGVFLSKTGRLSVGNMKLAETKLKNSFDVLVADMDRNYSYFKHKKINWQELVAKYRDEANKTKTADEFVGVISKMLTEMNDVHIWIIHKGKQLNTRPVDWTPNFDFSVVNKDLKDVKRFGRAGLVATTSDGLGYVRLTTLAGINKQTQNEIVRSIQRLFTTKGIIFDLRQNGGGDETFAQQIAGMFTSNQITYAKNKFRSGVDHNDFYEQGRVLLPGKGRKYNKKLVCMIGPGAVSSAEGFALMMKSLPNCTTVGKPTCGASGNPSPVHLADDIEVWYSRWMALTPDGDPIEDVGVQPDKTIEHDQGSDKTYERAKKLLTK